MFDQSLNCPKKTHRNTQRHFSIDTIIAVEIEHSFLKWDFKNKTQIEMGMRAYNSFIVITNMSHNYSNNQIEICGKLKYNTSDAIVALNWLHQKCHATLNLIASISTIRVGCLITVWMGNDPLSLQLPLSTWFFFFFSSPHTSVSLMF